MIEDEIIELRHLLDKYKWDIEQVILFGMERTDTEEKKQKCREMVRKLKELENMAAKRVDYRTSPKT